VAAIRPWKAVPGGAHIDVRLTPKGGRDAIDGVATLADGQSILKVRVRAAPSDGEANEALMRLVARALGVPPSAVRLLSGETTRRKRLTIDGDARALVTALEKIAG
jgi:uncharacterized protein YggU (UPF0235/DUF167 family)